MVNYNELIQLINSTVYENGTGDITGFDTNTLLKKMLNATKTEGEDLRAITDGIQELQSKGWVFENVVNTKSSPREAIPTNKPFYIATEKGKYENFKNSGVPIEMAEEGLAIIKWDGGKWELDQIYFSLSDVLSDNALWMNRNHFCKKNGEIVRTGGPYSCSNYIPIKCISRYNYDGIEFTEGYASYYLDVMPQIVFFDKDKKFISWFNGNSQQIRFLNKKDIPENAYFFIVNTDLDVTISIKKLLNLNNIYNELLKLKEENDSYHLSMFCYEGKVRDNEGNFKDVEDWRTSKLIPLNYIIHNIGESWTFYNTSGYGDSWPQVLMYDKNEKLLKIVSDSQMHGQLIYSDEVPTDTFYFAVNSVALNPEIKGYGSLDFKVPNHINYAAPLLEKVKKSKEEDTLQDLYGLKLLRGYYTTEGEFISSNAYSSTDLLDVNILYKGRDTIHVSNLFGDSSLSIPSVIFYNNRKEVITSSYDVGNKEIQYKNAEFISLTSKSSKELKIVEFDGYYKYLSLNRNPLLGKVLVLDLKSFKSGDTYFFPYEINAGDKFVIQQTNNNNLDLSYCNGNIWFTNDKIISDGKAQFLGAPFANLYTTIVARENFKGLRVLVDEKVVDSGLNILLYKESEEHPKLQDNIIYIAASDSRAIDKKLANYVCTGVNDERIINKAIDELGYSGTLVCLGGHYHIDSITKIKDKNAVYNWGAIHIKMPSYGFRRTEIKIRGVNDRDISWKSVGDSGEPYEQTIFVVSDKAFEGVPSDVQPAIFQSSGLATFSGLYYSDFRIEFPNSNHKCIGVNLEEAGHGISERITMTCNNSELSPMPVEGLVGVRCYHGYSTGYQTELKHIACGGGFYTSFEMGGEHVVATELHSRHNYIGYTFGAYGIDTGVGTFDHDITMINCCDEGNTKLPQFISCGRRTYNEGITPEDYPREKARQCIHLIDFVIEGGHRFEDMAKEVNPGQFCGYINFTAGLGVGQNLTNYQFWQNDGSGKNFKTENSTHAKGGTTAERKTYYGQYMQHYFDTDLNKELICVDPATQKWVDSMGVEAQ